VTTKFVAAQSITGVFGRIPSVVFYPLARAFEFSKSRGLNNGLAIFWGHNPVAFHPALIFLGVIASSLAAW